MSSTSLLRSGPFRFGFITTLGVLLALVLGAAIANLSYALTLIFFALFITLGLYPLVRKLESRRISRVGAVLIVMAIFLVLVGLLLWAVVPIITDQAGALIRQLPGGLGQIEHQAWFVAFDSSVGGALTPFVHQLQHSAADPAVWLAISGGALRVGANVLNGTFGVIFVVALTLYFLASLETMKQSLYSLIPATKRPAFTEIAEQIGDSVGKYLSGMFILAIINAAFTFLLLSVAGVRYAAVLAALALPITLIPLVGSVINTVIVTVVSLFTSPGTALVVLIAMLVYMQIEAYVLTPRIVGKAISIPGSLVLIGALVGGTLLGLLGALVACPVTASILLIIKKIVVPAQNAR
ncbi:AI-2E family transporter [Glaciibacter superstes]|uniref:AI-2E family transporter n=1 Tax=Glaciibacter superstes TaxID=501023 RepID=UPI0003B6AE06|nr:AI-2E family transporter [Glaciibacter superstes]